MDGVRWPELERTAELAASSGSLAGLRDAALLRLGSDCLLRVGELAAVEVGDARRREDGAGLLAVRRSKTDQEGKGATLYFGAPTFAAVDVWRKAAGVSSGPLFRRVWTAGYVPGSRVDPARFRAAAGRQGCRHGTLD